MYTTWYSREYQDIRSKYAISCYQIIQKVVDGCLMGVDIHYRFDLAKKIMRKLELSIGSCILECPTQEEFSFVIEQAQFISSYVIAEYLDML